MQKELNDYVSALLKSKFKEIEACIAEVNRTAENIHSLAASVQKEHWNLE